MNTDFFICCFYQTPFVVMTEIILHSSEQGIFKELWIADEIRQYVIEEDLWIGYGAEVGGFTAANEAIGTLILRFDTEEKMKSVLLNQDKYIQVRLL